MNLACPRIWEVHAARDGRLEGAAYTEFLLHAAHCRACAQERSALTRLQHALCASSPEDDTLRLRRVRQRVLAASRAAKQRAASAQLAASSPEALRLTADIDTRFERERRVERSPRTAAPASESLPAARPAQADLPAHRAPSTRLPTPARPKPQPESSSTQEDRAYLEVLDLQHAGRYEDARAAARRYCRNYPHGLRLKELEQLARSARP